MSSPVLNLTRYSRVLAEEYFHATDISCCFLDKSLQEGVFIAFLHFFPFAVYQEDKFFLSTFESL